MDKEDLFKFLILQGLDVIIKLLMDIASKRVGVDYHKAIYTWGKQVDSFYEEHLPNDP
jgi:hypothetical protein